MNLHHRHISGRQAAAAGIGKFITLVALLVSLLPFTFFSLQAAAPPANVAPPIPTPRQGFIVGGENAAPGELPWQVLVLPGNSLCGGTLIDTEWVLTAAHCMYDENNTLLTAAAVTVVAGEYDTGSADSTEQSRSVSVLQVHPNYDPGSSDNDVALLRLSTPVVLGDAVGTVALVASPANDALVTAGALALVSGWGTTTENGQSPAILQKVRVPLVDNTTCNAAYGGAITENMLCAGLVEGGKDSCQGDSGGPLVVPDGSNWRLAGVVSFGTGCAQPGFYGVYARVSRYTEWINEALGNDTPSATPTPEVPMTSKMFLPIAVNQ